MSPNRQAFTFVLGAFVLILGVFTLLKHLRAIVDAAQDAASFVDAVLKMATAAPFWAVVLILLGVANLLALFVEPWLRAAIARKVPTPNNAPAVQRSRVLSCLLDRGQALLTEELTAEQVPDWLTRSDRWERVTLKYLAIAYSHQDAIAFQYIHYNPSKGFSRAVNDAHKDRWLQNTVRCTTLKSILNREPEAWTTLTPHHQKAVNKYLANLEAQLFAADGDKAL